MTMCRHCGYAGSACDCVDRRAQPAAPAVCSSCDGTGKISGLPCAWCMQSAAPADDPNLIGLLCLIHRDGGHYIQEHGLAKAVADAHEALYLWREAFDAAPSVAPEPVAWTLQSELDAAQTTCSAHLWFTNPRNSAWTALFTREQIAAHPPQAPLTDAEVDDLSREIVKGGKSVNWLCRAIEQAHGIGGK